MSVDLDARGDVSLKSAESILPQQKRRTLMRRNFGLDCMCEACGHSAGDARKSDKTRQRILELYETGIPHSSLSGKWATMESTASELLELMKKEKLAFPEVIRQVAHEVCRAGEQLGVPTACQNRFAFWARLRYESQRYSYGNFREYTIRLRLDAEDWARKQNATKGRNKKKS